jgi:hypothetical protein
VKITLFKADLYRNSLTKTDLLRFRGNFDWPNYCYSAIFTKTSNADMTACLPLQDCIVQTTRPPAYGRKFLPPRCSPANKATGLRPDNFAPLQWQFLKLHTSALKSLAVAGYLGACTRRLLPCCSGRLPNCHLQWQDTKLHARGGCCPAAVAGYQTRGRQHKYQ